MMGAARILIAEDEQGISSFLENGLRAAGFTATVVEDGSSALALARTGQFDLLVLDLGLPTRDGLSVLEELRREGKRLPVVVLTARSDLEDMVAGLDRGADDYVTKPFRFEELLARIRARLRPGGAAEEMEIRAGNVVLDLMARRALVGDQEVELSAREFALAEVFFRNAGQVLSREQLLSLVWGYDRDPGSNVVDVYVGYLRKKLGDDVIATVRGMGYRLHA
jgi:DNA-binding response OmpR family regulator